MTEADNKKPVPNYVTHYTILSNELDSQYQHLHHAASLKYLEKARLDLLEQIGFPNQALIDRQLFLVISKIEAQYLREVRDGKIIVQCSDLRTIDKEVIMHQTLINERGKKAIEAEIYCQFLSGITKRATLPPDDFVQAFKSR